MNYTMFDTWESNNDGVVKAIAANEIDIYYGILNLVVDRTPYYTPILQIVKFE